MMQEFPDPDPDGLDHLPLRMLVMFCMPRVRFNELTGVQTPTPGSTAADNVCGIDVFTMNYRQVGDSGVKLMCLRSIMIDNDCRRSTGIMMADVVPERIQYLDGSW